MTGEDQKGSGVNQESTQPEGPGDAGPESESNASISLSSGFRSVDPGDVESLPAVEPVDRTGSDLKTRPETPRERPIAEPNDGPPRDARIGQTLVGRYRLERLIGKGGMGRVYLAKQLPLNRSVAVKILNPEFQKKDPQFVRRFFLEAATAARLNHPNTITIFDYGESDTGELFIAMEYLKGRALSRVIAAEGTLSADRTLHVTVQIVRALREAHSKGIIHRDLKPGNIMILDEGDDPNFAKVLDFGLVKLFNPADSEGNAIVEQLTPSPIDSELTQAGMFLGSPKYMSPEQIQGKDLDPRTDVYSLGVIMFQMLAGRVPFRGASSVEIIYKHVHSPLPAIHDLNPEADAPPELEMVVARCLAKNREDRVASMADLLVELKAVRRSLIGSASTSGSADSLGLDLRSFGSVELAPSYPLSEPPKAVKSAPSPAVFIDRDLALDDTPGSHPLIDISYAHRRWASPALRLVRAVPYVAALSLVFGLGVLAYQLAASQSGSARNAPVDPPARDPVAVEPVADPEARVIESRIEFDSRPSGVEVFWGPNLLGVTPFEHVIQRKASEPDAVRFSFRLKGHVDEVVEHRLDEGTSKIFASLQEEASEPVSPSAEKKNSKKPPRRVKKDREKPQKVPSDFKANPY